MSVRLGHPAAVDFFVVELSTIAARRSGRYLIHDSYWQRACQGGPMPPYQIQHHVGFTI
jgi:hypothetical protein